MEKKPSKELFLKALENVEVCDDQENYELLQALNSMSEEDKKIVKTETIVIKD